MENKNNWIPVSPGLYQEDFQGKNCLEKQL